MPKISALALEFINSEDLERLSNICLFKDRTDIMRYTVALVMNRMHEFEVEYEEEEFLMYFNLIKREIWQIQAELLQKIPSTEVEGWKTRKLIKEAHDMIDEMTGKFIDKDMVDILKKQIDLLPGDHPKIFQRRRGQSIGLQLVFLVLTIIEGSEVKDVLKRYEEMYEMTREDIYPLYQSTKRIYYRMLYLGKRN